MVFRSGLAQGLLAVGSGCGTPLASSLATWVRHSRTPSRLNFTDSTQPEVVASVSKPLNRKLPRLKTIGLPL